MAAVSLPAAWPADENQGPLKACYIGTYTPCPCTFIQLPSRSPTLTSECLFPSHLDVRHIYGSRGDLRNFL